jgi:hypothetical protein
MVVRLPKAQVLKCLHKLHDTSLFKRGFLIASSLLLTVFSCSLSYAWEYKILYGVRVIENQVITEEVSIEGSAWNGAIVRNNVFQNQAGRALNIRDVVNLTIENNEFYGMQDNAIKLRSIQTTGTDNVLIKNNYFHDIPATPVYTAEPNTNTKIMGNTFRNVATNTAAETKQHAMYLRGPGFLVEGNTIDGVLDSSAISVRTAGVVRGNIIKNATTSGIKYYSDSGTKGDGLLIIENNVISVCAGTGISLEHTTDGPLVDHIILRFNTLVDNTFGMDSTIFNPPIDLQVYGNIIISNLQGYLGFLLQPSVLSDNLLSSSDIGFIAFGTSNYRLISVAQALSYVRGVPGLPPYDYDGNAMGQEPYDAGAFQYQGTVSDIPPSSIKNLSASSATASSVTLTWTAPGEDGAIGIAASYDIRYSTSAINEQNFSTSKKGLDLPIPKTAGQKETYVVKGLKRNTRYYFAIKTVDHGNHISPISNTPSRNTLRR